MKALYNIDNKPYLLTDDGLQAALENAYVRGIKPSCNCNAKRPLMYIAKIGDKYIVKRMPNTGSQHDHDCGSYETPSGLSGLGEVENKAIIENMEDGLTTIKVSFSLSKGKSKAPPVPSGIEHDSVVTDGKELGMRSTLHFLWERAQFNKWTPAMQGKRNWGLIRHFLLEAAKEIVVKHNTLYDVLYIPENFYLDHKDEIANRRVTKLAHLSGVTKSKKSLMLAIGEIKSLDEARFGFKMIIKHLPDYIIYLNNDLHKRLVERFKAEFELWAADEKSHLLFIGNFGVSDSGVASFEELALMLVNENWIPYENINEKKYIDTLTKKNMRFNKSLRYNLPSTKALACMELVDEQKHSTALFIKPGMATESFINDLQAAIDNCEIDTWLWDAGSEDVPTLPLKTKELQHE